MTVSQADFDALKARCDKLERYMGLMYIEGPQLSKLSDEEFQGLRTTAPDLPNGEDNFAIDAVQQNRIQRDLRADISNLEARPSGTGPQGPKGDKGERGERGPQGEPGPAGTGSGGPADTEAVFAALRTMRIHVEKDPETNREYIGFGMRPDFDNYAAMQIGGGLAPWIAGYDTTKNVPGQGEGDEKSSSTVKIMDGDGGWRVIQYGKHGKRGFIRNTPTRPFTVLAMDSVGEVCSSQVQKAMNDDGTPSGLSQEEGGQNWYLKTDWARKLFRIVTFKPGWKTTIEACSTKYADADQKLL